MFLHMLYRILRVVYCVSVGDTFGRWGSRRRSRWVLWSRSGGLPGGLSLGVPGVSAPKTGQSPVEPAGSTVVPVPAVEDTEQVVITNKTLCIPSSAMFMQCWAHIFSKCYTRVLLVSHSHS